MLNKKIIVPVIAAVLMALGVNLEKFGINLDELVGNTSSGTVQSENTRKSAGGSESGPSAYRSGSKWSSTSPEINLHHIFEGEINRKGKPVGYHSRPGGLDPEGARLVRVQDQANSLGVYTAIIAISDQGQWKEKFSSFFPDSFSAEEVSQSVLNAYRNSSNKKKQPWQGPSGHGFTIQGYTTSRGGINTCLLYTSPSPRDS